MIAMLEGKIIHLDVDFLIISCQGVGYEVSVSQTTLDQLYQGEIHQIWVETKMRESEISLYGFLTQEEKKAFNLLTSVQGVGAKAALSILSILNGEALFFAVTSGDKAAITRANGIGPKIATRIISELSEKIGSMMMNGQHISASSVPKAEIPIMKEKQKEAGSSQALMQELSSALVNLGYMPSEVAKISAQIISQEGSDQPLEALIPLALKELSRL